MRLHHACLLLAFLPFATPAHAYGTIDIPSAYSAPQWDSWQRQRPYTGYEHRHRHHAKAHDGPRHGHSAAIHHGSGNLIARSGARASVSSHALPHFQCLVDRLEAAGYPIAFMGGYAARSNPSAHPTGNAVDINQTGRGRVTRRFPGNVEEMCRACGVYSGAHFGDLGHFELPGKYGYVNIGRRYASRHWRHRRGQAGQSVGGFAGDHC